MGRLRTSVACTALALALAACGGSSGGGSSTPPITLNGVAYERLDTSLPALRQTQGGDGGNFSRVIYVDDGAFEFLGRQAGTSSGTTIFRADDGSVALLTALPGFESTRLIRIENAQAGVPATEGIIGRFTSESLMATATGRANYIGAGTGEVRLSAVGQVDDLSGGITLVEVDFGTRRVDATLDFRGTPSAVGALIDTVQIDGMTINGNRFSGGSLTSTRNGTPIPAFSASGSSLSSSGVFAGWNDTTGEVAGGNRPAEVGGAFVANAGVNTLAGRYLAD